ncbi:hypothetical protein Tco_0366183 [Tanacetum coccineum]
MDDELVALADHLKIGKSNPRLSSTLKSKEPTLQVVLDALKLTSFYNAFEISADVPEIYMQEFWVTVSRHHSSLRFKLNGKSHTVNVENFRDMLKICPKLPGQKFEEPPLEEDILSFIRDLGHTGEIKFLSDVNVNHMHQPWRSFAAIINKCLSGKTTALESLRLSRAQILWGMYHNKKVDYVYLLWEDLKGEKKEALLTLKAETGSIHLLSETLSCCLVLKTVVMDPVTQCTTLLATQVGIEKGVQSAPAPITKSKVQLLSLETSERYLRYHNEDGNPLLEPTSNKLMVDPHRFEGYLKMEVKLKNLKKDALLKLFKITYQERYEHVGPEGTSSQDGKVYKMAK